MKDPKTMSLFEKLLEIQKAASYLQKENSGPQYTYVSGSQAVAAIRGKMDELGVILKTEIIDQKVNERIYEKTDKYGTKQMIDYFTCIKMRFTWVNVDNQSERDDNLWESQGVDIAGEKGIGKAATYGEKYFILKYFHIATDKEDPDTFQEAYGYGNKKEEPKPTVITAEQKRELGEIMKAKGLTQDDARAKMKEVTGKEAIGALSYDEAGTLIAVFKKLPNK